MTFEDWWKVNDCCGLNKEDAETIWMAGYNAACGQMRRVITGTTTSTTHATAVMPPLEIVESS